MIFLDIGGGAGEGRVNTKAISQNFYISKLFLLHVCSSKVFILLHEIPGHFDVQKGKKNIKLPYQKEKKILGSWAKVSHNVEKQQMELLHLLNLQ